MQIGLCLQSLLIKFVVHTYIAYVYIFEIAFVWKVSICVHVYVHVCVCHPGY